MVADNLGGLRSVPGTMVRTLETCLKAVAEDLASILPPRLRGCLSRSGRYITVDLSPQEEPLRAKMPDGQHLTIEDLPRSRGIASTVRRHLVALRVPDADIISTMLRIPDRAAAKLNDVASTNISVWTPFMANEIYFKAKVAARPRGAEQRSATRLVELRCVPKVALDQRIEGLGRSGFEIDEIWLGPDRTFAIERESLKRIRMRRGQRGILALAGLAAVQGLVFVVLYRSAQEDRMADLTARLTRLRGIVHERAMQAQQADTISRTLAAIRTRATGPESATHALSLLGHVLPAGARYRDIRLAQNGEGSLTIVSRAKIDPVALVAATGLMTVVEVSEGGGIQADDHVYTVAFKPILARSVAD